MTDTGAFHLEELQEALEQKQEQSTRRPLRSKSGGSSRPPRPSRSSSSSHHRRRKREDEEECYEFGGDEDEDEEEFDLSSEKVDLKPESALHHGGRSNDSMDVSRSIAGKGHSAPSSRGLVRARSGATSSRRMLKAEIQGSHATRSTSPPRRGLGHTKSGTVRGTCSSSRVVPTRSRSDAVVFADVARREHMKALYRASPDNSNQLSESSKNLSRSLHRDDVLMQSSFRRGPSALSRSRSGLEAGPVSAMVSRAGPGRTRSTDSADSLTGNSRHSIDRSSHHSSDKEEKWLERRANKMDEIMTLAQDVRERFVEERERQEAEEYAHSKEHLDGEAGDMKGDDDDDQPMAMRQQKTMLQQLKKVATKTGGGVRSFGKGTVNAIHDPKLAAKRFGHLSKDVGKATVKTALDPSKLARGAKKMTVGSAKMGAGITTGVAMTAFKGSRAVVKGGAKVTASSAKMTMKGTKKVVKGTARAVGVKKKHKNKGEEAEYDARTMADRNPSTFYDRIASMVESNNASNGTEDEDNALDEEITAAILEASGRREAAQKSKKGGLKSSMHNSTQSGAKSSLLMPTNLVGASSGGGWDL